MKKLLLFAAAIAGLTWGWSAGAASFLQNLDIGKAISGVQDLGSAASGLPEKDEIALGRELAGRTMGAAPLVNDRELQGYVNRIGRAIAAQSDRPELPWRFGVIDTPSVNAFAAPGGIILVTRGLYEILDNEAQLAAVLGHEVGHVMKRHHVAVVQKQKATSGISNLAQATVGQRDRTGLFNQFLGTGAEIFTKALDKDAEYEADQVGTILAAKAGYSMSGMIDVLQKLRARAGDPSANLLFETHPHPQERLVHLGDVIEPQIASLPPGQEPPPPLQVAADSLPAPVMTAGQPAPTGNRALSAESQSAEPPSESPASSFLPGRAMGGRGRDNGGGGGFADPTGILRGIMGR
jgi:predicted Zn-dependent protease